MNVIRNMHESVMAGLEGVQGNTSKILQEQEQDLLRAFRARLQDVTVELDSQRQKKGDFGTELQARHRRVVTELHAAQELAHAFDKKNQRLQTENDRLMEKLQTREDDRQALLKELVLARREVAALRSRAEVREEQVKAQVEEDQRQLLPEVSAVGDQSADGALFSRIQKSRKTIEKLKRDLLQVIILYLQYSTFQERTHVGELKKELKDHLDQRSEIQNLIAKCLEDVKNEIAGRAKHGKKFAPAVKLEHFTAEDREKTIEMLLSQERLVALLS